jgi:iron complex outermembrane receptor protein
MYRSAYYAEPENTPESRQSGYAKVDARIELGSLDDRWTIALFGRNLTDKHTFNFSYFWPFAAPTSMPHRLKFLEETRVIGISATAKF